MHQSTKIFNLETTCIYMEQLKESAYLHNSFKVNPIERCNRYANQKVLQAIGNECTVRPITVVVICLPSYNLRFPQIKKK